MSWMQKFLGGGRKPTALALLTSARWQCCGCDVWHKGMFALAPRAPDPWSKPVEYAPNQALRLDGDFLSEDFCVLDGTDFLVRACLEIPVHGLDKSFSFGCWSTLSRSNFEKYVADFGADADFDAGPWTGYLCNHLETYVGADPLPVWVVPQANGQRPLLYVADDAHPLAIAQDEGISPERVLEIYAYYGHHPGTDQPCEPKPSA